MVVGTALGSYFAFKKTEQLPFMSCSPCIRPPSNWQHRKVETETETLQFFSVTALLGELDFHPGQPDSSNPAEHIPLGVNGGPWGPWFTFHL